MAIVKSLRGFTPIFGKDCFLADTAVVVGEVSMGDACTVWFNAVVRGDVHSITVGDSTNIQDGAVIHCTYERAKTVIGSNVSVAHNAVVHGCTIEDSVLIGMGAIVMDHAVVKSGAVIAAGAVVLEHTIVEENSIYAGIPAKKVKNTGPEMRDVIERTARNYPMYSQWFKNS
ncbi:MAG: gamma carbonic anhydrase family protein [Bacteroidota bacterium]